MTLPRTTTEAVSSALVAMASTELALHGGRSPLLDAALDVGEAHAAERWVYDGEFARIVVSHALDDQRYAHDAQALLAGWEAGLPLRVAAGAARGGLATDLAAAALVPIALATGGDPEQLRRRVRQLAGATHADPVGPDGAATLAAALTAARAGHDALPAARAAAETPAVRDRLARAAEMLARRVPAAAALEHFEGDAWAPTSVALAMFWAATVRDVPELLAPTVGAATTRSAAPALAAALLGARHGAAGLSVASASPLPDQLTSRIAALASQLEGAGQSAPPPPEAP